MRWWDDLWLNESFAEYLAHRCVHRGDRRTRCGPSSASSARTGARSPTSRRRPTRWRATAAADAAAALQNFDGISYAKGASVLRQLAAYVGDDVFLAGLRDYIGRPRLRQRDVRRPDRRLDAGRGGGPPGLGGRLAAHHRHGHPGRRARRRGRPGGRHAAGGGARGRSRAASAAHRAGRPGRRDRRADGARPGRRRGGALGRRPGRRPRPCWSRPTRPTSPGPSSASGRTAGCASPPPCPRCATTRRPCRCGTPSATPSATPSLDPAYALEIVEAALPGRAPGHRRVLGARLRPGPLAGAYAPVDERPARAGRVRDVAWALVDGAEPGHGPPAGRVPAGRPRRARPRPAPGAGTPAQDLPAGVDAGPRARLVGGRALERAADRDRPARRRPRRATRRRPAGCTPPGRAPGGPTPEAKAAAWRLLVEPSSLGAYELYATGEGFWDAGQNELTAPVRRALLRRDRRHGGVPRGLGARPGRDAGLPADRGDAGGAAPRRTRRSPATSRPRSGAR